VVPGSPSPLTRCSACTLRGADCGPKLYPNTLRQHKCNRCRQEKKAVTRVSLATLTQCDYPIDSPESSCVACNLNGVASHCGPKTWQSPKCNSCRKGGGKVNQSSVGSLKSQCEFPIESPQDPCSACRIKDVASQCGPKTSQPYQPFQLSGSIDFTGETAPLSYLERHAAVRWQGLLSGSRGVYYNVDMSGKGTFATVYKVPTSLGVY